MAYPLYKAGLVCSEPGGFDFHRRWNLVSKDSDYIRIQLDIEGKDYLEN